MKEICTKYESLFIFGTEQDLQTHLELCPDCKIEHEKMQKVANLVKEVKPLYRKKSLNNRIKLKIAASFIILTCSFWVYNSYTNEMIAQLNYESELLIKNGQSLIADQGLPTDEYGLLRTE
ncbi:MAG: hypothetical protein PHC34_09230 [Candidatus Gastranaerophilales bacterium]|nr:hypothetical protein [Candidatus Gastranaerophilales bacterium]